MKLIRKSEPISTSWRSGNLREDEIMRHPMGAQTMSESWSTTCRVSVMNSRFQSGWCWFEKEFEYSLLRKYGFELLI